MTAGRTRIAVHPPRFFGGASIALYGRYHMLEAGAFLIHHRVAVPELLRFRDLGALLWRMRKKATQSICSSHRLWVE